MGILETSSDGITKEVESITNENNTEEDWQQIIALCDKAGKSSEIAKKYLKSIVKRLHSHDPHIAIQAVTLLDACVKNCGKTFHVEVASREFESDFQKLMRNAHVTVAKKLRESLKRWSENEFKSDPQLNLIPSLYNTLVNEGLDFSSSDLPVKRNTTMSKDPNVVESQEEEDQILKAIELSLKETNSSPKSTQQNNSLYPLSSLNGSVQKSIDSVLPASGGNKELKKVRALYDFEAAEDNELTFNAGELILVLDDSDPNWWKGRNQRGDGLFPVNFVTEELNATTEEEQRKNSEGTKKSVQFNETVNVKQIEQTSNTTSTESTHSQPFQSEEIEINEEKIDRLIHLLHEADPTNPETDTSEMLTLEHQVNSMNPLIDAKLESVDRKHAQLTQLSADLVEALGLYHQLMREPQYLPTQVVNNNKMQFYGNPQSINYHNPQCSTLPHPNHPHPQHIQGGLSPAIISTVTQNPYIGTNPILQHQQLPSHSNHPPQIHPPTITQNYQSLPPQHHHSQSAITIQQSPGNVPQPPLNSSIHTAPPGGMPTGLALSQTQSLIQQNQQHGNVILQHGPPGNVGSSTRFGPPQPQIGLYQQNNGQQHQALSEPQYNIQGVPPQN